MTDITVTTTYAYTVEGKANDGQTWITRGEVTLRKPAPIMDAAELAMKDSFRQLTGGKAIYGLPGVGCRGPYTVVKFTLEKKGPLNAHEG